MRESRTYGSVRGARDETRVPTATTARVHRGARGDAGVAVVARAQQPEAFDLGDPHLQA